jgi:hypothetical protein
VLSKDPGALVFAPTLFSFGKLFSLGMFLAFPHAKSRRPSVRTAHFRSPEVLRDVAQNVSFAGSILDVYRAKEQVILAMLERDVVVDIPQYDFDILVFPMLVRKLQALTFARSWAQFSLGSPSKVCSL